MNIKAIVNTNLILEDNILFDGAVVWQHDRIIALGKEKDVEIPKDAEIIDAGGLYTAPGLVDIHNHGGPSELFWQEPEQCCEFFLKHGTTTVLPTFYCNLTEDEMLQGLENVKEAMKTRVGKMIAGIYMEGPYMSGFGSNQKYIRWNGAIERREYENLIKAMKGYAKIWAIDPIREGIEGFMADVKAMDEDAIFALGHSRASASACKRVKKYGVKVQTHFSDSGQCPGRAQGTRGAGCDEFTLLNPDMYAELICDECGIHVDPEKIKTVVRIKGVERMILITDHMADKNNYKNNEADGIYYGPDLSYDYEGHLAGSRLTLENACRNLMTHTGYGLCHAVRMASFNPAELLGLENEIGSLDIGKKANIIIINDRFEVKSVFLNGERM